MCVDNLLAALQSGYGVQMQMLRYFLLTLLVTPAAAGAFPWYVDHDARAGELEQALEQLWPDHPIEVVVGESPPGEDGLTREDGRLVLVANGRVYERVAEADPMLEVVMVRSWFRDVAVTDGGWVPEPPAIEGPPNPPEPPPPEPVLPPPSPAAVPIPGRFGAFAGVREAVREPGLADMVRVGATGYRGPLFTSATAGLGSLALARARSRDPQSAEAGAWRIDRWTLEWMAGWSPSTSGVRPELSAGAVAWRFTEVERIGTVQREDNYTALGPQLRAAVAVPLSEDLALRPSYAYRLELDANDGLLDQSTLAIDILYRPMKDSGAR